MASKWVGIRRRPGRNDSDNPTLTPIGIDLVKKLGQPLTGRAVGHGRVLSRSFPVPFEEWPLT